MGILIVPFVQVYTAGITDADYIQPVFAIVLTVANAMHTLRIPYNVVIMAAGHYKQTQRCYIIASVLNLVISIASVYYFGLIGVAVGTLIAMGYQTIWMAIYVSRNVIEWPLTALLKKTAVNVISIAVIIIVTSFFSLGSVSYFSWIVLAVEVCAAALLVQVLMSVIFYRAELKYLMNFIKRKKNI